MNLYKKLLKRLQLLCGGLSVRLERLSSPDTLIFAPDGWSTILDHDRGWNDPSVVAEEKEKWDAFLDIVHSSGPLGFSHEHTDLSIVRSPRFHNIHLTFGYVLALVSRNRKMLSMLDYGGGLGHYYQIGKALLPDLAIEYHCKEVQSMAEAGKLLNPEVIWHTDNNCLKESYDLVMISGSLQYIEHWQEFLLEISNAMPVGSYLYLTRVPIVETAESYLAVQKTYNTRLLHWQFNKSALLKGVEKAGFRIIREFVVGDTVFVNNAPEQFELRGWLFQKEADL